MNKFRTIFIINLLHVKFVMLIISLFPNFYDFFGGIKFVYFYNLTNIILTHHHKLLYHEISIKFVWKS
jgi:hypothetical protein